MSNSSGPVPLYQGDVAQLVECPLSMREVPRSKLGISNSFAHTVLSERCEPFAPIPALPPPAPPPQCPPPSLFRVRTPTLRIP